jgi:putative resolvase
MPVPAGRLASGTIWVDVVPGGGGGGRAVVYARVSGHDQRADLDGQVARLTEWVTSQGIVVADVVCEVGSGMNGRRPKLRRILSDPSVTVIVVEHRDRLARLALSSSMRRWPRSAACSGR